jgi:hypothetical protein
MDSKFQSKRCQCQNTDYWDNHTPGDYPRGLILHQQRYHKLNVPDEGLNVPDEGLNIPDEGFNIPDEGYSRKALYALNKISTFLLQ